MKLLKARREKNFTKSVFFSAQLVSAQRWAALFPFMFRLCSVANLNFKFLALHVCLEPLMSDINKYYESVWDRVFKSVHSPLRLSIFIVCSYFNLFSTAFEIVWYEFLTHSFEFFLHVLKNYPPKSKSLISIEKADCGGSPAFADTPFFTYKLLLFLSDFSQKLPPDLNVSIQWIERTEGSSVA